MKRWSSLIVFFLLYVCFFPFVSDAVQAAELTQDPDVKKILLVYDDLNQTTDAQERMTTIQNILLSLGVQVTVHSIDEYRANELDRYDGLIEVVNASDLTIRNEHYRKDRVTYPKLKFHMGRRLPIEWQNEMGIKLRYIVDKGVEIDSPYFQASEQLIREIKTEAVSDAGDCQVFSSLNFENHFGAYPYAVFKDKITYVPFYIPSGVNFIIMQRVLATWLGEPDLPVEKPLLVFRDVTPVSDLQMLREMTDQLYQAGASFAVSATGLWNNLDQEAATNYLNTLNEVAEKDGSIFLQTPYINDVKASSKGELKRHMETALNFFIEHHVYPAGVSFPSYWQHDAQFQPEALLFSDTMLLLPDTEEPIFHEKTNTTQNIPTAYVGISHDAFSGVEWRTFDKKGFLTKTALVLPMPKTHKELKEILDKVLDKPSLFDDLMYSKHHTMTMNHDLKIIDQQIYVDGQRQWIATKIQNDPVAMKEKPYQSMETFFAVQNKILTVIVLITLGILTLFLVAGYFLYKKKYRR